MILSIVTCLTNMILENSGLCIYMLRTSVDPKMVQILTEIFKTLIKKLIFIKVLDNHLYTQKA